MPFKAVKVFMGDTATSVNQGGASGSTGIQEGGRQMRMAAAEARRVLVDMAADKLGLAADQLTVTDGVVHAASDAAKKVSYADLIGGRYFNVQLDWNKKIRQSALRARQGQAEGSERSQDRRPADQARGHRAKSLRAGELRHRRESARHGARPHDPAADRRRGAGQGRRKLDQGHSRRQGGLGQGLPRRRRRQGMGCDQGDAAAQGRVVGCRAAVPRIRLRSTTTSATRRCARRETGGKSVGNVDDAFKSAARVIEAEYEWPFQSHASMGPACAVVEIKDGKVTCWSGRRSRTSSATASRAILGISAGRRARDVGAGSGLLRPQRRRRRGDGRGRAGEGGRQAGAPAIYARSRHRLGSEGPRLDPSRARRDRCLRQRHRLRVPEQGLSARRRRIPTSSKPYDTLAGQTHRRGAEVRRRLRRAGGILRLRQQAHLLGDHRAAARSRLAAALVASARSGRTANPFRQRIVHGRSWRTRSMPTRSSSGCAT